MKKFKNPFIQHIFEQTDLQTFKQRFKIGKCPHQPHVEVIIYLDDEDEDLCCHNENLENDKIDIEIFKDLLQTKP